MPTLSVAQAQARLVQAEQDLARVKPLLEEQAVSRKNVDDAVAETLAAKAALEAARSDLVKAKFDLDNTLITAPVNGRIGRSHFYEGRLVSAQTTLLTTIDQLDPMYVNVSVPESYLLRRRRDLAEHRIERPDIFQLRGVMTFSDGSVYPGEGLLDFADVNLRSETGMLQTRFTFPNPEGGFAPGQSYFYPGQFVKIRLKGYIRPDAILIPQRAVQQMPTGSFVYVIGEGDKAELRPVQASLWYENEWLIDDGLRPGERVVVEGFHRVRPGAQVTAVPFQGGKTSRIVFRGKTHAERTMSSHFFIDRPIFASVLSIIIVVLGLVSLQKLPIAQFPQITPPMVQIDADYPGASAEVVAEAVARPIEVQLPGIDNLLYYDSTSTNDGHMTMRLTFEIGTDVDIAQVQTQNRQRLAEPQLPDEVIRQGITVKKTSPDLLAVIMLSSTDPRHDTVFLSNYALLRVLDNVKRLPGVGDAIIFGGQNYSMRLILDPVRMAQLDITPTEVAAVVREQNRDFPAGRIGREPTPKGTELTIPVITRGRMSEVKEFEDMIVRAYPDGSMVRMRDIARVELGAQSYDLEGRWNGKPNTFLLTFLSPGANALETVKRVRQEMEKLSKSFPPGVSYDIPYDTTIFIDVSIKEVVKTLIEATLLVILVVFLFLQSWRATLIPAVAVPISLIGTLAGMEALGFSINTLTLFGMVLAIGIVVDDAIVVVENVERHMTKGGLSPRDAAKKAMDEVTGPVIAIVLVLAAVFVPVAFLGGITGELYKQFAITIALSVAISGFVALTLSPALCALVLKPGHDSPNKFWNIFNRSFDWLQSRYVGTVGDDPEAIA